MPISKGGLLFDLVKSLTKAEKRNFSLYAKKIQKEGDAKFLQLFDVLDRIDSYEEGLILQRLKGVTKSQFVNLRRHLYQHLLTSLRLVQVNKRRDIQIRELIDYAYILYGKGLYLQALKLLNKAKSMAIASHLDLLHLEILEFEKLIESRHITRATTTRIYNLMDEAAFRNRVNAHITEWTNLKLRLQREFINNGHIRTQEEGERIREIFKTGRPTEAGYQGTFFERVYEYESQFWLHYLLLDFDQCNIYAGQWVDLYREKPNMIDKDVDMYMRGMNHLMTIAFCTRQVESLEQALAELEVFRKKYYQQFNDNSRILSFLYVHQGRLNACFLRGDFERAYRTVLPKTLKRLKKYEGQLDRHKIMILYYKIAWLHLGNGHPGQAVLYLKKIIDHQAGHLRDDLHLFAHLLFLMAHFELGSYDIVEYLLQTTATFFEKSSSVTPLQKATFHFFKKLFRLPRTESRKTLDDFRAELEQMAKNPLERRDFIFLDVPAWVASRLSQRPLAEILRKQFERQNEK